MTITSCSSHHLRRDLSVLMGEYAIWYAQQTALEVIATTGPDDGRLYENVQRYIERFETWHNITQRDER